MQAYVEWVKTSLPASAADTGYIGGYISSSLTHHVLKQAGDKLTRANIMQIASHLMNDVQIPLLLPGITMKTTPTKPTPPEGNGMSASEDKPDMTSTGRHFGSWPI